MKKGVILTIGVVLLLIGFVQVSKFGGEGEKSSIQGQKAEKTYRSLVSHSGKQENKPASKSKGVRPSEKKEEGKRFVKREKKEDNFQLRLNNLQSQLEKVGFSSVGNTERLFKLLRNLKGKIIFKDEKLTVHLFAPTEAKISEDKLERIVFNIKRKESGNIIILVDKDLLKVITVYNSNFSKPLAPDQIVQLFPSEDLITFSSSRKIRFYFDKTEVISEDKPNIDKVLSDLEFAIKKSGAKVSKIIIEGHTDNIGSEEYNLALSLRRAQILNNELRKRFKDVLIVNIGKGEKFPIDTNDTLEGRKNNRRIGVFLEFSL